MWFKQAQLFQFDQTVSSDVDELSTQLEALAFTDCLPNLPSSCGFIPPLIEDDSEEEPLLVYSAQQYVMLCLQIEEKLLPASVVRQAALDKIEELEKMHGKKLPYADKKMIKEEMLHTMLPRAFSKKIKIYAYIDLNNKWLIINNCTSKKIELFISLLKRALGVDFCAPKLKKLSPLFTKWLKQPTTCPNSINVNKAGVLQDPNQSHRVIRCQQQSLYAESIQALLEDGCEAVQLSLSWQDDIEFTLAEDFSIRAISYSDELIAPSKDLEGASKMQVLHADLMLMAEALAPMLQGLLDKCLAPEAITA